VKHKQLIIVEGPDGAGKTTLINALKRKARQFKRRHHGAYTDETDIAQHYMKSMWPAYTGKYPVIMDRSWLAEPIYGTAFRGGQNRITAAQRRMLERVALSCRGVVIRCLPPFDVCAAVFKERQADEYLDSVKTLRAVYSGYKKMTTALPVMGYDWQVQTIEGIFDDIEVTRPRFNAGPGAGHWAPGEVALLVGERLTSGMRAGYPPFVSLTIGMASRFTTLLEEGGIPESRLYWVNALGRGGKPIDPGFILTLKPRIIIALGSIATGWCRASSHTFESVFHPHSGSNSEKVVVNLLKGVFNDNPKTKRLRNLAAPAS
jgi:thymidylate kinase